MSFDPRIVPADDAPLDDHGAMQLPDDLAELAAQLGEDATYLAALYPAHPPAEIEVASPSRFPKRVLFASLAGMVLSLIAVSGWNWLGNGESVRPRTLVAEPTVASERVLVVKDDPLVRSSATRSFDDNSSPETTTPVFLLYEYSGPELEGVYDLLEETPQQEISF